MKMRQRNYENKMSADSLPSIHFIAGSSKLPMRSIATSVASLLLGLFGLLVVSAVADTWRAGVARVKITPQQSMWMSGYASRTQPARGTRTELWAKALALQDADSRKAVLITMDLVGIGRELSQQVCQRIEKQYHLARAAVVLSVSHTHTGPVVGDNLAPTYELDERQTALVEHYSRELADKLVEVVGKALDHLQPVQLMYGMGTATFAVNRRNNSEAEVVLRRAEGRLVGPVDHDVPVLAVKSTNGELQVIVCGYACHATVLRDLLWSGDWPGFAQLELEKRHPGAIAMFWAGCGADQNPLPRRKVELAENYGRQLADAVDSVLNSKMESVWPELHMEYEEISLTYASLPSRAQLEYDADGDSYNARRAKLLLQQWDRDGQLEESYPYPVQVWRLGRDLTWVFLGGEVVVDYSLRLKHELSPRPAWIAAYANDVMAYIPSRRVLLEGGYEGGVAMVYYGLPSPWDQRVEERIVAKVHELADAK